MIERILPYLSKEKIVSQAIKMTPLNRKLIIMANLDSIYKKLRENGIIKPNKMKACSKFKMFLYEDHEIISQFKSIVLGLLNYYYYCDNFYSVKSIINYFVRQSLVLTLKYKYKASSLKNICKKYGNTIEVKHSLQLNKVVAFFSCHEINSWKTRFNINDNNITFLTLCESMFKIYFKFK